MKDYAFLINYQEQCVYLYPQDTLPTEVSKEGIVEIALQDADTPFPKPSITVGGHTLPAYFDTGDSGSLTLTPKTKVLLEQNGSLSIQHIDYEYGLSGDFLVASLKNIKCGNTPLTDTNMLGFQIGDVDCFAMGYQFLKYYQSLWIFNESKIYLIP